MAESLTQALLTQTPDTNYVSDAVSSIGKGAASAASLEQLKLHNQQLRDQIDEKKEQFNNGVFDRTLSLLGQAARAPNVASRNFMLEYTKNFANKYGYNVGENIDYINKAGLLPEIIAQIEAIAKQAKQNPAKWPQIRSKVMSYINSPDPTDADPYLKDIQDGYKQEALVEVAKAKDSAVTERHDENLEYRVNKDIQDKFSKPQESLATFYQSYDNVKEALKRGDTTSIASMGSYLARMFGETGALSRTDVENVLPRNLHSIFADWETKYFSDPKTPMPQELIDALSANIDGLRRSAETRAKNKFEYLLKSTQQGVPLVKKHGQLQYEAAIGEIRKKDQSKGGAKEQKQTEQSNQSGASGVSDLFKAITSNPEYVNAIKAYKAKNIPLTEVNARLKNNLTQQEYDQIGAMK